MDRDEPYRYWAFISYSHADEAWAKWLHKALETYRVPRRIAGTEGRFGPRPSRLYPVFRDRDELASASELGSVIEAALRESRYLIVICSPNSAKSKWVDAEIRRYKARGRGDRVLALIVDGVPNSGDDHECFPAALRHQVDARGELEEAPAEPIAADARPFADHKHGARLKLIAGLLGLGYDELFQRERQRRFWQRVRRVAAAGVGVALLAGMWTWFQQREVQLVEEGRLDRLTQLGRQELNDDHHARAAVYFTEVLRSGRDTVALRYWLARAMQPVDAVEPRELQLRQVALRATLDAQGKHLLTFREHTAEWWNAADGTLLRRFEIPQQMFLAKPSIDARSRYAAVSGIVHKDQGMDRSVTSILDLQNGTFVTVPGQIWAGTGLDFSPDSRHLLTAVVPSTDVTRTHVAVYDTRDGRKLAELRTPHGTSVSSFSADGRRILTGGEAPDGGFNIWDADSYRLLKSTHPRQRVAHSAYWSGRGQEVLTINEAGAVKLWDGSTGELLDALGTHSLFALAVDSAQERYWLTSSVDGSRVWDVQKGQAVFETGAFGGFDGAGDLAPSGLRVVGLRTDAAPGLWSVTERRLEHALDVHAGAVSEVLFEPDGQRIVVVAEDGRVRWLRTAALARPAALLSHDAYVDPTERPGITFVQPSIDGRSWISGGADGAVRMWRMQDGAALAAIKTHASMVTGLAETAGGAIIVSLDSTNNLQGWDGHGTQPLWQVPAVEGERVLRIGGNPRAPSFAALVSGHLLRVHDSRSGKLLREIDTGEAPQGGFRPSILQLKGDRLLFTTAKGEGQVWDTASGQRLFAVGGTGKQISALFVSTDRQRGLIATEDGTLSLWNIETGQQVNELPSDIWNDAELPAMEAVTMSPDGTLIAAGTRSGKVLLWNQERGESRLLHGHQRVITHLDFSTDGRLLVSGSDDGAVFLWDTSSATQLDSLGGSQVLVDVALSRTGDRLATVEALNDNVRLWNIGLETRGPAELQRRLDCAVPWRLEGTKLLSRTPDAKACVEPSAP